MSLYHASSWLWIAGLLTAASASLLLLGPGAAAAVGVPGRGQARQPFPTGISLNEFMPQPASDWNGDGAADQGDEYIEIYNANPFDVDISGWIIDDSADGGSSPYVLPPGAVVLAQRHLLLFATETGIDLADGDEGDELRLMTPDGVQVESYGYAEATPDGAYSKTADGSGAWTTGYPPSPGAANLPPAPATATNTATATSTPTETGTPAASATPTPTPTAAPVAVSLNEFMPNPAADWNNDGILGDDNDEYIELYNANDFVVDLSGWKLDDVAGGGSSPYTLPGGTTIAAHSFLVFWSRDTNIALNNSGGDSVRLLTPDGVEVESHAYTAAPVDGAYSKTVDGGSQWTQVYPPSPGASNQPPVWTATPTATPTRTATATRTATPTPTPTATPGDYPDNVSLNEFMPNPESDWNGDGILGDTNDEYIELYNANDFVVDLSGWKLDDVAGGGSSPYTLPGGTTIAAHSFLVFWSRDTNIALNNSGGDSVRLLRPDGVEMESYAYTAAPADGAYSKTVDGGAEWTQAYPPSPGATNQAAPTATPTPTATPGVYPDGVSLNEYMPDPASDWNGDGAANQDDEYIELYNANDAAVDLSGWRLDDMDDGRRQPRFLFGPDGSPPYVLPAGTTIPAHGFLLLFRSQTGLALNNDGDWVRLLRPDGVVVEATEYSSSRNDEAASKTVDGGDQWTHAYPPSPGASNQPAPTTPTPTPTPIATPTPTATPGSYSDGVSLNEFMPNPASDWNNDGILGDENDEYIELYNANDFVVDLSGWQVDDVAGGGSSPYTLPAGTMLAARGFLPLWSRDTHIALNNSGGDSVRLVAAGRRGDGELRLHGRAGRWRLQQDRGRRRGVDPGLSALAWRNESSSANRNPDAHGHAGRLSRRRQLERVHA
ncbi:MAG: lamin tail domain-containing protein [Anaerolineae bacterium]